MVRTRLGVYLIGYALMVLAASWFLGWVWDLEHANEIRARDAHLERMR